MSRPFKNWAWWLLPQLGKTAPMLKKTDGQTEQQQHAQDWPKTTRGHGFVKQALLVPKQCEENMCKLKWAYLLAPRLVEWSKGFGNYPKSMTAFQGDFAAMGFWGFWFWFEWLTCIWCRKLSCTEVHLTCCAIWSFPLGHGFPWVSDSNPCWVLEFYVLWIRCTWCPRLPNRRSHRHTIFFVVFGLKVRLSIYLL